MATPMKQAGLGDCGPDTSPRPRGGASASQGGFQGSRSPPLFPRLQVTSVTLPCPGPGGRDGRGAWVQPEVGSEQREG